jgi:hypothetical protein
MGKRERERERERKEGGEGGFYTPSDRKESLQL